jgi:hypothetical protein
LCSLQFINPAPSFTLRILNDPEHKVIITKLLYDYDEIGNAYFLRLYREPLKPRVIILD